MRPEEFRAPGAASCQSRRAFLDVIETENLSCFLVVFSSFFLSQNANRTLANRHKVVRTFWANYERPTTTTPAQQRSCPQPPPSSFHDPTDPDGPPETRLRSFFYFLFVGREARGAGPRCCCCCCRKCMRDFSLGSGHNEVCARIPAPPRFTKTAREETTRQGQHGEAPCPSTRVGGDTWDDRRVLRPSLDR